MVVSDSFRFPACNFIKKKAPGKMFICEFCKIFKNIFRQKESTKSRGLRCSVGPWVAWVRGYVGCVSQNFTWVAWVTWVKIFFMWVNILRVSYFLQGLRGSNIFLRGSNFFAWVQNFLRGSLRGWQFFAWVTIFCVGLKKSCNVSLKQISTTKLCCFYISCVEF